MNIIVTNNNVEYTRFVKVKTLKEVDAMLGDIEFLVYNKSPETQDQKVEYLTKLRERVGTLVYVRNKENMEQAIQLIVVGSDGKYVDDEFFLESSEELDGLITSLDEVTAIVSLGGVSVLSDFFNRYLKEGSSGFNANYLKVVKNAVQEMIAGYRQKDMEIVQLSTTATEIFSNSTEILAKIRAEQAKLQESVLKLEDSRDVSVPAMGVGIPSMVFFPTVSYLKDKNIIRVKDIGNCSYLTSFMIGFRLYLEKVKYARPKLIFIVPVGVQYEKLYSDFNWVTSSNHRAMSGYYNPVVFTNYPTKDVITRLLDDADYDTFIVIDRLLSSNTHILKSRGLDVKYAVNGVNVLDKFKLKASQCFSSIRELKGGLFTIPVYPDYPQDIDQRERLYMRNCEAFYEILSIKSKR